MVAQSVRILLADDNPAFLAALQDFLASQTRIEVVGTARSGREAVERLARLHPDLVLLDLVMPEMNGLEALRRIKAQSDAPRVVMLTLQNDLEFRIETQRCGADDYLTKTEMGRRLLPLIETLFPRLEGPSEPRP